MNPERWREIERIYNAALELESGRRDAYLAEACAGDESLRNEIDALLRNGAVEGDFMQAPAIEFAARALAEERAAEPVVTLTGRTIAHYKVMEKLGEGGMGVVYCAGDTNLSRHVAIKVLPNVFAGDPERLARFEREAKLLASLSHPNIAAIHGLEQDEGKRFLVLELVEGQTVAQRLLKGVLRKNSYSAVPEPEPV